MADSGGMGQELWIALFSGVSLLLGGMGGAKGQVMRGALVKVMGGRLDESKGGAAKSPKGSRHYLQREELVRDEALLFQKWSFGVPAVVLDEEGRPVVWNSALVNLLGYDQAEFGDMHFADISLKDSAYQMHRRYWGEMWSDERESYVVDLQRWKAKDGSTVAGKMIVVHTRGVLWGDGRLRVCLITILNRTEEVRAKEDLLIAQNAVDDLSSRLTGKLSPSASMEVTRLLSTEVDLAAGALITTSAYGGGSKK